MQQKAFEDIKTKYVLTYLYSHIIYKKKQQLLLTTLKKAIGGVLSQEGHSIIYVSKADSSGAKLLGHRAGSTGNCVCGHKLEAIPSWKTLQSDHKPLKYLFAPDEEIPKTASARITRWAIALTSFDYELKYTPGEQIPHADASSRMDFDEEESDNDRVCFAIIKIYFAQSDLVTQAEIKTELGTNRLFQDILKRIKISNWKQCSEKGIRTTKMHWPYTMESSSGVVPFIPPKLRHLVLAKAHETHSGKNATEASVRMIAWWPGIT